MTSNQAALPREISMPGGETFVPVVMRVLDRDEHGMPENAVLVPLDRAVEMVPDVPEEFVIVYIDSRQIKRG